MSGQMPNTGQRSWILLEVNKGGFIIFYKDKQEKLFIIIFIILLIVVILYYTGLGDLIQNFLVEVLAGNRLIKLGLVVFGI